MLNICVVSSQAKNIYSGPGLYTNLLIHSLLESGHRPILVSLESQRPTGKLPYKFYGISPKINFKNLARWIPNSVAYGSLVKKIELENPIDLFHFTDFRDGLFCFPKAPKIANINDTYTLDLKSIAYYRQYYTDWFKRFSFYTISNLIEKLFIHRYDLLLANSEFTQRICLSSLRNMDQKCRVVYKSVQPIQIDVQAVTQANQNKTSHRILFIGGNMQRKGLLILLDAFRQVLSKFPSSELWVVGDDPNLEHYQQTALQIGVSQHVKFLGYKSHEEVLQLYGQCTLFTLPSLTEALGVVILEAMTAGIPVIGTNVGGIPEIIHHNENGLLVPPGDANGLAEGIVKLLSSASLRREFILASQATVEKFSADTMMERTYELYDQILASRK